ncbi:hypothetical protein K439DRAFT_1642996 [Ramaria rubella]|nr:hypothetical protein K439DRAFT_1642996 [Ramaria rubella]
MSGVKPGHGWPERWTESPTFGIGPNKHNKHSNIYLGGALVALSIFMTSSACSQLCLTMIQCGSRLVW